MIKYLLTELGRAGREFVLSAMTTSKYNNAEQYTTNKKEKRGEKMSGNYLHHSTYTGFYKVYIHYDLN